MAKARSQYDSDYSYVLEQNIEFPHRVVGYPEWLEKAIPSAYRQTSLSIYPGQEAEHLAPVLNSLWLKNNMGLDLETSGVKQNDGLDPISATSRVILGQFGTKDLVWVVQPELIPYFKEVLESAKLLHVNQNITFDFEWLLAKYGIHVVRLYCTMLAEQLLQAGMDGYGVSLLDLARKYPPCNLISKQVRTEFSNHSGIFTEEQIYYAARDIYLLFPIFEHQNKALRKHKLINIAQIEFNAIPVTAEMELTGVNLDRDVMLLIIDYWTRRQAFLEQEIKQVFTSELQKLGKQKFSNEDFAGVFDVIGAIDFESFDLDSNEQKMTALKRIGLNPENTQRKTLKEIDHKLTKLMVEYSVVRKRTSTYGQAMLDKVHPDDNRFHPSWKQMGMGDFEGGHQDRTATIATGRYSGNFQQLPRPEEIYEIITDPAELAFVQEQFGWEKAA